MIFTGRSAADPHPPAGRGRPSRAPREEAKAACVATITAKPPGRPARETVCLKSYPGPEAVARLDAYRATLPLHEGKTCSRSRAVEGLLMALPAAELSTGLVAGPGESITIGLPCG